ncbi:sigma-70 family RNA polymerase sigma factor [Saccharothrix sp. HUAS TT1]|uniref:sigma-70 family RNA polymerase sigma factor n=1 Tax=unclassified Saccharothrix TaxID=2593673 RepID=UPI00345B637B
MAVTRPEPPDPAPAAVPSVEDRLRAGDETAERELFELCQRDVRAYLRPRLPNSSDLDDCVSEVVARALDAVRRGRVPQSLRGWLFGIARNVLKDRYKVKAQPWVELPDEVPWEPGEPKLDVDPEYRPHLPADLEHLLGKQQLWQAVRDAVAGIPASLQPLMTAHLEQTRQRGEHVVGAELARVVGLPVRNVDRQLKRARDATKAAVGALVLVRHGEGLCPTLNGLAPSGKDVVLDPSASVAVTRHAAGCRVCGPRLDETAEYRLWALGPGLLGLVPEDDEEQRRLLLGLLGRSGDAPVPAAGVAVPLTPWRPLERLRAAAEQIALSPRVNAVIRLVDQHPELVRRVAAGAAGVVGATALLVSFLVGPDAARNPAQGLPGRATTTDATATSSAVAGSAVVGPGATTAPLRGARLIANLPDGTDGTDGTDAADPDATTDPAAQPTTTAATTTTTTGRQAPSWNGEITVDATTLGYTGFSLSAVPGTLSAGRAHVLRVPPGDHRITTSASTSIPFHVADDGGVSYAPEHEGALGGRGTSTLALRGLPVVLDATGVDYQQVTVTGAGWPMPRSRAVREVRLLPGAHALLTSAGSRFDFEVTTAGRVNYRPEADRWLDGGGTSTLAPRGTPVVLDATDVDYSQVTVTGTGWPGPVEVRTVHLLPGAHAVHTEAGGRFGFEVAEDGTLAYQAELTGLLTGAGGTTLAVHGAPTRVDATRSGQPWFAIGGAGWWNSSAPHDFRLLPGTHTVHLHDGRKWTFTTDRAGLVDYAPTLDPLLEGRGTATLAFR